MTSKTLSILAAAVLGGALLVAAPAQAGTTSTSTSLGSATLTIEDATFEASGCLPVPLTLDVNVSDPDTYWNVDITARLDGTSTTTTKYLYGTGTTLEESAIQICPFLDGAGTWLVTGTLTMTDYATMREFTATLETSFTVAKASTRIVITRIKPSLFGLDVTGKVTSTSANFGVVGVSGSVVIQVKKGRKWIDAGTGFSNNRGVFTADVFQSYPRKTVFRAVYRGDDQTKPSTSKQRRY